MALNRPIVVMKFGGTSVGGADAIRRAAAITASERERTGSAPVVVVSAMAGVTDRLLALAREAAGGEKDAVHQGVEDLRRRHREAAASLVPGARGAALVEALDAQLEELRAVLLAVSILREASPQSVDAIAAAGELLGSRLVAAAFASAGLDAVWVDARRTVITDAAHTCAAPLADPTREAVRRELLPLLAAGIVPVAGGFVGARLDGVTTTLGRGGSDYSAALFAAALHDAPGEASPAAPRDRPVAEIQIWTDVDGMLTADPRLVNNPGVLPRLSFAEAAELAYFGAKVLHPSTILPAMDLEIPVRILNSLRPEAPGTLITSESSPGDRPIAALACKQHITVIEVTSTRMLMAHGFLRRLFEVFERHGTPVDVVTTSEVSVSVTVDDEARVGEIVEGLRDFAEVAVERDMAILCAVGDRLRAEPALAIRLLGSLEGLPLRMVSQASSRRNLTVVLHGRDAAAAMRRLHQTWFAEPAAALAESGAGA